MRDIDRFCYSSPSRGGRKTAAVVTLLLWAVLVFDVRHAHAYIDPLIPGFLYQIGYLILYGLLAVGLFFRQSVKRLFSRGTAREQETDDHEGD